MADTDIEHAREGAASALPASPGQAFGALAPGALNSGSGFVDIFGPDAGGLQLTKPEALSHSPDPSDPSVGYDPLVVLRIDRLYIEEYEIDGEISRAVEVLGWEADEGYSLLRCPSMLAGMLLRLCGVPYEALNPGAEDMGADRMQEAQARLQRNWKDKVLCVLYVGTDKPKRAGRSGMKRFDVRVFDWSPDTDLYESKSMMRDALGAAGQAVESGNPKDVDDNL